MSIFKQSFPKWIQNQLSKRQELQSTGLNGGFKSHEALSWNQSKQCVIRATSLVDYVVPVEGGLEVGSFEQIKGNQLSKRFTLQGGILDNGNTRGKFNSNVPPSFGQPGSAYGDPLIGASANSNGFGQVPMPGITSLDIATKSAYGSLRQAKLNFVVHSLKQLEIMELLYMRPGYPIVVEWQWSPYIHSIDGIINRDHNIGDILFKEKVKQDEVYSKIVALKKESEGNYDAFLGFVTNFGFQARSDGGFDCYSEIVSMGEALDSLKIGSSSHILGKIFPGKEFTFKLHKEDEDEEIKNPDILRAILLGLAKFTGTIDTAGGEIPWAPQFYEDWVNNEAGELADVIVNIILEKFPPLQKPSFTKADKIQALEQYILKKNSITSAGEFSAPLNTGYVRWDLIAFLINELVIARPEGEEKGPVEIVQGFLRNDPNNQDKKTFEPLKYVKFTGGNSEDLIDLSCDPGVCILPHSFFDSRLQEEIDPNQGTLGKVVEGFWDGIETLWNRSVNLAVAAFDKDVDAINPFSENKIRNPKEFMYYIGGIYLNTEMLLAAYNSSIKSKDLSEADLGDFFKAVWDNVNTACPLHNFIFKIDSEFSNTSYVIDLPVDNSQLNEIKDKLFTVEVQSNRSIVREYDLQATIPDALKSTVAVHAQNPDTTEDLDDLTFQAFNRNIKNRIFIPPQTKTKKQLDKEAEDKRKEEENYQSSEAAKEDRRLGVDSRTAKGKIKKRYLLAAEKFSELTPLYFEIINADENGSVEDSNDKVTDLKSSLKELQTSALQLEKSENENIGASAVIPLEFTMTLDGISNIVIGSVFKIRGDRLPKAYRNRVAFIVFKEEQSITSGQDWTTKIGGKMIILPTENQDKKVGPVVTKQPPKKAPVPEELPPPIIINNEVAVPDNTFVEPPPPPGNELRTPLDQLTTSEAGLNIIKDFESFEAEAYVDPGTGGEPITIGYGTTRYQDLSLFNRTKVRLGDTITEEQADRELKLFVERTERKLRRYIGVPLTQFEFDSIVSWTYNVGGASLRDSTLRKKLNAQDYEGAAEEFPKWNKAAGRVLAGLTRRRAAERNLYLTDNPGNIT